MVRAQWPSCISDRPLHVKIVYCNLKPGVYLGTVKNAMNEINAQQRLREANAFKADAEKILLVKAAEVRGCGFQLTLQLMYDARHFSFSCLLPLCHCPG